MLVVPAGGDLAAGRAQSRFWSGRLYALAEGRSRAMNLTAAHVRSKPTLSSANSAVTPAPLRGHWKGILGIFPRRAASHRAPDSSRTGRAAARAAAEERL